MPSSSYPPTDAAATRAAFTLLLNNVPRYLGALFTALAPAI